MKKEKFHSFGTLGLATTTIFEPVQVDVMAKYTSSQPVTCANGTQQSQGGPYPDDAAMCAVTFIEAGPVM